MSVCLLATSRKNYWSNLHEHLIEDVPLDNKDAFKFCKSLTSDHADLKTDNLNFAALFSVYHCKLKVAPLPL